MYTYEPAKDGAKPSTNKLPLEKLTDVQDAV